jgi:hypothetical protein
MPPTTDAPGRQVRREVRPGRRGVTGDHPDYHLGMAQTAIDIAMPVRITETDAWQALVRHHRRVRDLHLRDLFRDDPERATRDTADAAGLFLDYSKNRTTAETLPLLLDVARAAQVEARRD